MKHLLIIAAIFVTNFVSAQTPYETGMQKGLTLFKNSQLMEAEQIFERIAAAEPNEWLPNYYISQINSLITWEEKDPLKVKAQLDKAQNYLNDAMTLEKDNADILVMQAQILTNWVAFDGMNYGMKYAAKIAELYEKAYAMAPENPMVVLARAEWNMGSARYFGQDVTPFCGQVEKALELFINFKPKSSLHPNWGKDHAQKVLASCKA